MEPTKIQSPVRGDWSFMNPPGHHPDAKDFVAVNENGVPYKKKKVISHLFYKLSVTDTYAWEREVFSPFDAEVTVVQNGAKDRRDLNLFRDLINGMFITPRKEKNDIGYFLGNYIVLKSEEGVFAVLAHLRQGSVLVSNGEKVEAGRPIAKVGNSGNTIQPHLHFQIMKEDDLAKASPIPFIFEHSQMGSNDVWESVDSTMPRNFQQFRV